MTVSTWENLEIFTITSATGSTQLYANGRQQVKLRITLQAIDINGEPVAMTPAELASLQLTDTQGRPIEADPLNYVTRKPDPRTFALQQYNPAEYDLVAAGRVGYNPRKHDRLQYNKYRRDFTGVNWMWSRMHNPDYAFFPQALGERQPEDEYPSAEKFVYRIDVYVRTISLTPLTVAAMLIRRDGQKVYSYQPRREKGTLTLNPAETPKYSARQYDFPRSVISGNVDSKQYFDSLDYYAFNLMVNHVNVEFLRFDMTPVSIRRDALAPKDRGSITGYTYPGDENFNFGMALKSLPSRLNAGYRQAGKVYVCLVRQSRFTPVPGGVNRDPRIERGPTVIRALDMYGNDHRVHLQFQGNGRNYLELV